MNLSASQRYYAERAAYHAQRYGIDPGLFSALIGSESSWKAYNPSGTGPFGIAQFTKATAKQYGVTRGNPESELDGAARYMSDLLAQEKGDWHAATLAYKGATYSKSHARAASIGWNKMLDFAPRLRQLFDLKTLGPSEDGKYAPDETTPYQLDPRSATPQQIYDAAAADAKVNEYNWLWWGLAIVLGVFSLYSIVRGK